jgi:hypothetical protein
MDVGKGRAPSDITRPDLIQMTVGPAHGGLNDLVQAVEPDVERHFKSAKDRRLHVVECDLETGNGGGTHAATLRACFAAAQCQGSRAARSLIV